MRGQEQFQEAMFSYISPAQRVPADHPLRAVRKKNRDRLLAGDVARLFFEKIVGQAERRGLLSNEHFTVDGTLEFVGRAPYNWAAHFNPAPRLRDCS
jgi:hypothetical protein